MKCLVLLMVLAGTLVGVLTDCVWNVNKDLAKFEPVFVKKIRRKHTLLIPSTPQIELKTNQGLIAVCPGPKNTILDSDKTFVKFSCISGSKVQVEDAVKEIKNISCKRFVSADIINTNINTGLPSSSVLTIGFQTDLGWLDLFNVSYDFGRSTPLYSQHIIHGGSLKGAYTGSSRPGFSNKGLPSKVPWSKIFTKLHQLDVLTKLMPKYEADVYLNVTTLSRGHLAPDADFYFNSWEYATYSYANVVPQWQSINAGNWLRIEKAVRHKAKELQEDLYVTTGGEGVSTLKGNELYLSSNDVPVPRYIWKIVCSKQNDCIAFVIINNPFENEAHDVCENLCSRRFDAVGWYLSTFDDVKKGRMLCCSVQELKTKEGFKDTVPALQVDGILRY